MVPALEPSPAPTPGGAFGRVGRAVQTGWPGLDGALRADAAQASTAGASAARAPAARGLVRGGVHEWLGTADGDGDRSAPWSPPVLLLAHLAERAVADAAARGLGRHVVWIGRSVWPYPRVLGGGCGVLEVLKPAGERPHGAGGHGLELELALHERAEHFSAADGELFARSLFVDVDGRDEPRRRAGRRSRSRRGERARPELGRKLWAIDTALRCPSVTAVVADGAGLDMAASRRLQLVAARSNALVLLARPPVERGEISAATTRWWIEREGAEELEELREDIARGVRWRARLLRAKGAQLVDEEAGTADLTHRTRPALEAVHELVNALHPRRTEREDDVQRGGNHPASRDPAQRSTVPLTDERSPCGASSPSTSPTSPPTSPRGAARARPGGPARSRPPASS